MRTCRWIRASAAALLLLIMGIGALLAPLNARAADCHAGTLVTVVAHLDDDLLFVNPGISDKLQTGWCVTTVHLIERVIAGEPTSSIPFTLPPKCTLTISPANAKAVGMEIPDGLLKQATKVSN